MAEELTAKKSNVFDDLNGDGSLEGAGRDYRVVNGTEKKETINSVVGDPNWINADAGNDVINGKNAYDMLAGNEGNDKINASKATGEVEIYGGADKDTLTGSAYNDWIAGNEGNDSIKGGKGDDTLLGGDHNKGSEDGNDVIYGEDGNDVILGGLGADTITGGKGKNTIIHHNGDGNDVINLTKGENFTLKVDSFVKAEIAANKKDVLIYTKDDEYITIKNLAAKDVTNDATKKKEDESSVLLQVAGKTYDLRNLDTDWDGNLVEGEEYPAYYKQITKSYTGSWLDEQIDAYDYVAKDKKGNEIVNNTKGLSINGNGGEDWIFGSQYNDTIKGGDGNDWIWTYGGNDKVYGGNGHDNLVSEDGGSSKLYGEKGSDLIEVKYDGDVAYGGDDDDQLHVGYKDIDVNTYGKEINATIFGGKGNDVISIFTGGATVNGEAGNDVIYGSRTAASNIVFSKGGGHDVYKYNAAVGDTLVFDKYATSNLSFEIKENQRADKYYYYDGVWKEDKVKTHTDLVITYGKGQSVAIEDWNADMNLYIQTKDGKVLLSDLYVANKSNVFDDLNGDGVVEGEGRNYVVLNGDDKKNTINAMSGNSTWINAGAGNDVINGKNAYDMLAGNEGNDKINASKATGDVEIYGGADKDTLTGSAYNDWIAGNEGNDSIKGGKGHDTLLGGDHNKGSKDGNDVIYGEDGNDVIKGGLGADTITGGKGQNTIIHHKGDGNDIINLTKGEQLTLKVDSFDYAEIAENKKDVLVYTKEGEIITIKNLASKDVTNNATKNSEDTSDVLLQVAGQDPIDLRNYMNDWYPGYYVEANKNYTGTWLGEQIEAVSLNGKGLSINAGKGDDHIYGTEYSDTLKGGDGDDMIWTYGGKDKVYGGNGDDYLIANAGDTLPQGTELEPSTLYGEKGNDIIEIWNTGDIAYGGDGDDIITVNNDNSKTAFGGKGNDQIRIGSGGATVYGEAGDDIIDGGNKSASNIIFAKGGGHDIYKNDGADDTLVFNKIATSALSFENSGNDLVINYGKNESVTVKNYADDMGIYVETKDHGKILLSDLYAAYKNESLYTEKADKIETDANLVYTGAGNDIITITGNNVTVDAGTGNDKIYGGNGNDILSGGVGKDSIYGGDGDDEIAAVSVNTEELWIEDTAGNFIDGGKGNDWIYGSNKNDTIYGGDGDDYVWTYGGKDLVYGGNGNDMLISEDGGSAKLYGEAGDDYLELKYAGDIGYGGEDNDWISMRNGAKQTAYAGNGNDRIEILQGNATVYGEAGNDTIVGAQSKYGEIFNSDIIFANGDGNDVYEYVDGKETLVFKNIATPALSYSLEGNNLVISYGEDSSVAIKDYFKDGGVASSEWGVSIQTKNGTELLSEAVNIDEIKNAVAGWLSTTGYTDVAEALANRTTDEQVANLVAIFENANINV